jgi:hypothetical protein
VFLCQLKKSWLPTSGPGERKGKVGFSVGKSVSNPFVDNGLSENGREGTRESCYSAMVANY